MANETLVKKYMKSLEISKEEAEQLIRDDKAIDKGEKLFELSPEQEKASKKARQVGANKKPTAYSFSQRKRKENPTKRDIINLLFEALKCFEEATIVNPERVIAFNLEGEKFEIALTQKRKPKG